MLHKRSRFFAIGLGIGLIFGGCQTRTPGLDAVLAKYPDLGSGVYEELRTWEKVLGPAETVRQEDGGNTFFYWPDHGVAAFTHPLYEGQSRSRPRDELRVTSVIIPLKKSVKLQFLPMAEEAKFKHLVELGDRDLSALRPEAMPPGGTGSVDLLASPGRRTIERLHFSENVPIALEVRDSWWWSHYD